MLRFNFKQADWNNSVIQITSCQTQSMFIWKLLKLVTAAVSLADWSRCYAYVRNWNNETNSLFGDDKIWRWYQHQKQSFEIWVFQEYVNKGCFAVVTISILRFGCLHHRRVTLECVLPIFCHFRTMITFRGEKFFSFIGNLEGVNLTDISIKKEAFTSWR